MKLRSLTLSNVRKFAGQTATISGIGDGVSVVSEANEFGKSTFFDALHALFFLKYSAATREVKSLQSNAGGAVRVAADIELPEGRFTLEKSFLAQKRASVKDASGTVIALDDEAERWIAALMANGLEGPAGLLWVRQGVTALEPAGSTGKEKETLLGARQSLLSSVAGEIDMITGGRRMDRVIEAATQALARLATKTGRPFTQGPWHAAQVEMETHQARHDALDKACRELSSALHQRREVAARLKTLDAPDRIAALDLAVAQAEKAHAAAAAHAEKLTHARGQVELRLLEQEAAQSKLDTLIGAARQYEMSKAALDQARRIQSEAAQALGTAEVAVKEAQRDATKAEESLSQATATREAAQQEVLRQSAADRYEQLRDVLAQVVEKQRGLSQAKAALATQPATARALAQIEDAQATVTRKQRDVASGGVQMALSYTGAQRVLLEGQPLETGSHQIAQRQVFDLQGIGQLTIDPGGAAVDTSALEQAQNALRTALAAIGARDVTEARAMAAQRAELETEVTLLARVIETLAPDGVQQMQEAVEQAKAAASQMEPASEAPPTDPAALSLALDEAQEGARRSRSAYDQARDTRDKARAAQARAQAELEAAQAGFETAQAAYGASDSFAARQDDAARNHSAAQVAVNDAQAAVDVLERAAPDLASATAELTRARSAAQNARDAVTRLRTEHAELSATIRTRAEDGVEEKRDEAAGLLQRATERAARFAHEAAGLSLLVETLRSKRGAAQEAYFGPVQQELTPLLALLHADAALSFDPSSMLPQGLSRAGVEEPLDRLSGGTQEQIAILTRLAFARLFARQGKPMPIILDDALVYSDDNRITAMFTALHRVATDQQVIVFTCRQMAFAGLGGVQPLVQVTDDG